MRMEGGGLDDHHTIRCMRESQGGNPIGKALVCQSVSTKKIVHLFPGSNLIYLLYFIIESILGPKGK